MAGYFLGPTYGLDRSGVKELPDPLRQSLACDLNDVERYYAELYQRKERVFAPPTPNLPRQCNGDWQTWPTATKSSCPYLNHDLR